MKLILDMNISPKLVNLLIQRNINAKHWCMVGENDAKDSEIFAYAKENDCIIVTSDLDFTTILSVSQAKKPSIIQIRKQNLHLATLAEALSVLVNRWENELQSGAILTLDMNKDRIRLLPLRNV